MLRLLTATAIVLFGLAECVFPACAQTVNSPDNRTPAELQRDRLVAAAQGMGLHAQTKPSADRFEIQVSADSSGAFWSVTVTVMKNVGAIVQSGLVRDPKMAVFEVVPGWAPWVACSALNTRDDIARHPIDDPPGIARLTADCRGEAVHGNAKLEFSLTSKKAVPHAPASQLIDDVNKDNEVLAQHGKQLGLDTQEATKEMFRKLLPALDLQAPDAAPSTPSRRPPALQSEQIDAFLDVAAAHMMDLVGVSENTFIQQDLFAGYLSRSIQQSPPFIRKRCADAAESIWDISHGLMRAHVARLLVLNDGQKRRAKALGFWADWLRRMADPNEEHPEIVMQNRPAYPVDRTPGTDVPTPPQLRGEDVLSAADIPYFGPITSEYSQPVLEFLCNVSDAFYTRGVMTSLFLAATSDTAGPVAWSVLPYIPRIGPILVGAASAMMELGAWVNYGRYAWGNISQDQYDRVSLTWTEHLANLAAVGQAGYSIYRNLKPNSIRANLEAGIDNGAIPDEVKLKYGGKSYRLGEMRPSTLADGSKIQMAEAEYAVVGPHKGAKGSVNHYRRTVAILKDSGGYQRFFEVENGKLGQPIFFLGEEGYHIWSHLTEIKSGHQTTFSSLIDVFEERTALGEELRLIERMMSKPDLSLDVTVKKYLQFVNGVLDAEKQYPNRMSGYYIFQKNPSPTLRETAWGKPEANTFIRVDRLSQDAKQLSTASIRISIDPSTGKLMNVFVHEPRDMHSYWMGEYARDHLLKTDIGWIQAQPRAFDGLARVLTQRRLYNWDERMSALGVN